MQPDAWGHHTLGLCHNPPCIYARTLEASRVPPPVYHAPVHAPEPSYRERPTKDEVTKLSVELLMAAGGKQARALVLLLADQQPHTSAECLRVSGAPTMNALTSAIVRLNRRGVRVSRTSVDRHVTYRLVLTK